MRRWYRLSRTPSVREDDSGRQCGGRALRATRTARAAPGARARGRPSRVQMIQAPQHFLWRQVTWAQDGPAGARARRAPRGRAPAPDPRRDRARSAQARARARCPVHTMSRVQPRRGGTKATLCWSKRARRVAPRMPARPLAASLAPRTAPAIGQTPDEPARAAAARGAQRSVLIPADPRAPPVPGGRARRRMPCENLTPGQRAARDP